MKWTCRKKLAVYSPSNNWACLASTTTWGEGCEGFLRCHAEEVLRAFEWRGHYRSKSRRSAPWVHSRSLVWSRRWFARFARIPGNTRQWRATHIPFIAQDYITLGGQHSRIRPTDGHVNGVQFYFATLTSLRCLRTTCFVISSWKVTN